MKRALLTAVTVSVIFVAIVMSVQSTKAQIAIAVTSNSTQIDVNDTIQFTARVTGGMLGFTIKWYSNGVLVTGATSPIWNESIWDFTPTSTGRHSITASVTDVFNYQATSTKIVTVIASPTSPSPIPTPTPERLSINLSPQHSKISVNQTVNFTASVSGGTPPYSYHWYSQFESFSNPLVEVVSSSNFTFAPTSSGVYFIRFSVSDSLGDSTGQFLTPLSVSVSEYPSPSASPTPAPSPTPTLSPSDSPAQQPTSEPTQSAQPTIVPISVDGMNPLPPILGVIAVVIVAIVGLAVYFTKNKNKKEKP